MPPFPALPDTAHARVGNAGAQCGAAKLLRDLWGWGQPAHTGPFPGPSFVADGLFTERFFQKHHVVRGENACVLLAQDNTVVLLRQHLRPTDTAWQAWPMPLRLRGATTPSLLADRWLDWGFRSAFDTLPPLARGWSDVADGATVVSWWPLSDGWTNAPQKPEWAKDLKTSLGALALLTTYHAHRVGYAIHDARLRIDAALVDMDGDVEPPTSGITLRGTGSNKAIDSWFEGALRDAMDTLVGELRAAVPDVWFLHTFLSHAPDGSPRITSGTLASVTVQTPQTPVSSHALLKAVHSLPSSVLAPFARPNP